MISPEDLRGMSDEKFRNFFRDLLRYERERARVNGHVAINSRADTKDDGVDGQARMEQASGDPTFKVLYPGADTIYQLKANIEPAKLKEELERAGANKRLREHMAQGGHYALVTQDSQTEATLRTRVAAVVSALHLTPEQEKRVHVIAADDLHAAALRHVALLTYVAPSMGCTSLEDWLQDTKRHAETSFIHDARTAALKNDLQAFVSGNKRLLYVGGHSGSGKSRVVAELVRQLNPKNVIAFPAASLATDLLKWLMGQRDRDCLIIADDAGPDDIKQFEKLLIGPNNVKLIALGKPLRAAIASPVVAWNGPEATTVQQVITQVAPQATPRDTEWVLRVAGENILLAILIARKLADSPDRLREQLARGDVAAIVSVILGDEETTKRLARQLAIFDQVGFTSDNEREFLWVVRDAALDLVRARDIVADLRDRSLLEGTHFIGLRPLALRIHLILDFFRKQVTTADALTKLLQRIEQELPGSTIISRMMNGLAFAIADPAGAELKNAVLGPGGMFASLEELENRADTFRLWVLADHAPSQVLDMLERNLGGLTPDQARSRVKKSRRAVVSALEICATEVDLFDRSAQLLALLALGENEGWSNNATGTLVALYSPATGYMAPTKKPALERLPLARQLIAGGPAEGTLGLKLLGNALQTHHVKSIPNDITSRTYLPGWTPKTAAEIIDYVGEAWREIEKASTQPHLKESAEKLLADHARAIFLYYPDLRPEITDYLRRQVGNGNLFALDAVVDILAFDAKTLAESEKAALQAIETEISSTTRGRLMRLVLISPVSDELEDRTTLGRKLDDELALLADQALKGAPGEILDLLGETATGRKWRFLHAVGERDKTASWWQELGKHPKLAEPYLLGIRRQDASRFFSLVGSPPTTEAGIRALARGLGDTDVDVLIQALTSHPQLANPDLTIWPRQANSDSMSKLIKFLIQQNNDQATQLAFGLAVQHGVEKGTLRIAKDVALELLQCDLELSDGAAYDTSPYGWVSVATALVNQDPAMVPQVLDALAALAAKREGRFGDYVTELIDVCAAANPAASEKDVRAWLLDNRMISLIADLFRRERRTKKDRAFDESWAVDAILALPPNRAVDMLNFIDLEWPSKDASPDDIRQSPMARVYQALQSQPGIHAALFNSLSRVHVGSPSANDSAMAARAEALAAKIPDHPLSKWLLDEARARRKMAEHWAIREEAREF